MSVSIFSAGPSLLTMPMKTMEMVVSKSDIVIAVNDAINHLPIGSVHWYSAGDWNSYIPDFTSRRPTVGWLSLKPDQSKVACFDGWGSPLENMSWLDLEMMRHVGSPAYSITAAIALAHHFAAGPIHLWCHDMLVGSPGSSGLDGGVYNERRFKKEAQELEDCMRYFRENKVDFTIHHRGQYEISE